MELGLSADRRLIHDLAETQSANNVFCEIIRGLKHGGSAEEPKLYKPAMIDCVLDGIESGEVTENRILFDWIAPKCIDKLQQLGQPVTEKQVAYPFFHLTTDLFWMLAYENVLNIITESPSPGEIRDKVRHAVIKPTFWRLFTDEVTRGEIRKALRDAWWPESSDDDVKMAFERFRKSPVEQFRIALRRHRAAQLRELLADPSTIDLDTFNREA
jgi:predicted restriction endonuclease